MSQYFIATQILLSIYIFLIKKSQTVDVLGRYKLCRGINLHACSLLYYHHAINVYYTSFRPDDISMII